eukprot:scaffold321_cov95-Cylindrotheca_fusiformis.AAC.13
MIGCSNASHCDDPPKETTKFVVVVRSALPISCVPGNRCEMGIFGRKEKPRHYCLTYVDVRGIPHTRVPWRDSLTDSSCVHADSPPQSFSRNMTSGESIFVLYSMLHRSSSLSSLLIISLWFSISDILICNTIGPLLRINMSAAEALSSSAASSSASKNNKSSSLTNNKKKKKWLVVDFDDTCTTSDTTPILPQLAGLFEKEERLSSDNNNNENDDILQEKQRLFSILEQEYLQLYGQAKARLQDENNNITTLLDALEILDEVSNQVTAKVTSSGVLKGLRANQDCTDQMIQLLQKYSMVVPMPPLRDHCGSVLSKINQSSSDDDDWDLGILSINWCPSLICALLQPHLLLPIIPEDDHAATADNDPAVSTTMPPIWCNTVDTETGEVHLTVPGALAKQQRIIQIRKEESGGAAAAAGEEDCIFVVYVGDSATDLAALIESDIGILIGNSTSARMMAEQWGDVSFIPLKQYPTTTKETRERKNVIWTTECWSEIASLLLSTEDKPAWLE